MRGCLSRGPTTRWSRRRGPDAVGRGSSRTVRQAIGRDIMRSIVGIVMLVGSVTAQSPHRSAEFARVHRYCEGPVFDADGNLFVSHTPYISKIAPDGTVTRWAETGQPNGHKVLPDGTHLVADLNVLRLDRTGKIIGMAAKDCGSRSLGQVNDITLAAGGGFYFTDPGRIPEALDKPIGKVCYVGPDGSTRLVVDGLRYPNGLVLTARGDSLLLGEFLENRILEFRITAPGSVSQRRVFAEMPNKGAATLSGPDGMALDLAGRLYVAHYGFGAVRVFDTAGHLVDNLSVPYEGASNVVFGGPSKNLLYVTGGGGGLVSEGPGFVHRFDLSKPAGQ